MKTTVLMFPLLLPLLWVGGCSRTSSHAGEGHAHEEGQAHEKGQGATEGGDAHGVMEVPIDRIRGLRLMQVAGPRTEGRWLSGEALGDEAGQVLLSSPVKGIVTRLLATPGQDRGAGAPLANVQSPELAHLKAGWIAAKSKRDRLQSDLAREERLFLAGAGARRDLENARSEAETARAEEEAARLGLEALGLRPNEAGASFVLKAPGHGAVVSWKVQQGQGVEAGQELGSFQAAQASIVRLEVAQEVPDWKPGDRVEVRGDGRAWKARLEGMPTARTAETRRLIYRFRLEGSAFPAPGTAVDVRVPTGTGIYLPQAALQQMEGAWGVFVVEGKEARFRPVRRGADLKDEVLILEGLKTGETLVAEGAYLLKAYHQKRTEPEEAGHGH